MRFHGFGSPVKPVILLLHGGGLSWWSMEAVARRLERDFYVLVPTLDGHGEEGDCPFESIEATAAKLITYIDECCGGKVHALCGLSLGAQVVVELLALRSDVAQYAIVESALVIPMVQTVKWLLPTYDFLYGLVQKRWFARWQAKSLWVTEPYFEAYYADSRRMTKETLINITWSNGTYSLKETLAQSTCRVMVAVGERELSLMKRSAQALSALLPFSELRILSGLKHGQWSLKEPKAYEEALRAWIASGTVTV